MDTTILYQNENGIEFWTVKATGESAVSVRGLSRMCGIPEATLRRWFKSLRQNQPLKGLESLSGKDLELRHMESPNTLGSHVSLERGGKAKKRF